MQVSKSLLSGIVCSFVLAQAASASIIAGPVTSPINGHTYYLLDYALWNDSEAQAESLGGHLCTIRSYAENVWVGSVFINAARAVGNDNVYWIGLYRPGSFEPNNPYKYSWISGEPVTYEFWYYSPYAFVRPGQEEASPYVYKLGQDSSGPYAGAFVSSSDFRGTGIVEVVPEPDMTLGFAPISLLAVRRRR